uniref:Uncharacterized protein n=1 Tax=Xiphophorus couchianus TaxID=32473 RepID=A0A3B5L216_9TELE
PRLLAALSPAFDMSAIRPVENQLTYTNISVYFTLYGILGVVYFFFLFQWWKNEFISWDPVQCGTDKISLPKEKFWIPDIVINEFMEENKAPSVPYVYLFNDGTVRDSFPVRVVSSCNLIIYTFPFDIQNCSLTFNSYIYYVFLGRDADLITEFSKEVMTTMGEWELVDITAKKLVNDDIRVRRRATMYVVNLLLPSCFLITVDLFSFLLPAESTDRSSFKMTLILGYTVFLLIMNNLLPVTGNTIPLISEAELRVIDSCAHLVVVTMSVVAEMKSDKSPEGTGGSAEEEEAVTELKSLSRVLQAIRCEVEQQQNGKQSSEEWIQVGFIIDRLLFGLYIAFISVSFITIIIVWIKSYKQ